MYTLDVSEHQYPLPGELKMTNFFNLINQQGRQWCRLGAPAKFLITQHSEDDNV